MLTDLQLALKLQDQYDGKIALIPNAPVDFSILQEDGITYLLYEGSHDVNDAMRDLDALMVDCPFGRVHAGAWEGVSESLPASLPVDAEIVCAGHSLGAMRAQLAYRELYRRGYKNLHCITFECPRFGDHQAIWYGQSLNADKTYQNYLNLFEHDAFTMIPLHLPLEPYESIPNCTQFWSAPTANNEWKDWPLNIQAHSLSDCVIPYLQKAAS